MGLRGVRSDLGNSGNQQSRTVFWMVWRIFLGMWVEESHELGERIWMDCKEWGQGISRFVKWKGGKWN